MPSIADLGPLNTELIDRLLNVPRTRHTVNHPGGTIMAECSAVFESQLVQFMTGLRDVEELRDGFRIRFGWSHVVVRQQGDGFRLEEPDINGDPYHQNRSDVTLTLLIASWQALVCRRAGAVGPDSDWQDELIMAGDALDQDKVFLKRETPGPGTLSGWYLGGLRDASRRDLQPSTLAGFKLWQKRPAMVTVLCLPPEYLAVFDGDTLQGIADPNNHEVWATA